MNQLLVWIEKNQTHVFARDVPHIADIHDATLMPDDTHGDGVFAHFRGYVAIHFDAEFFQHQQPCTGRGQRSERAQEANGSADANTELKMTPKSPI